MAIQLRRGNRADLIPSKLLPGEFAICSDGTVVICHAPGQTKVLATRDDVEDILNSSPDAYNALQELMEELKKTGNPVANILASIQELRETKADKSYVDSATDYIKSASGILIHLPDSVHAPVAIRQIEGNSVQIGTPTPDAPVAITHTGNTINVVACGKNLLRRPYVNTTKTVNGITFTDNGDGTFTANGTATGYVFLMLEGTSEANGYPIFLIPGKKYAISEKCYLYVYMGSVEKRYTGAFVAPDREGITAYKVFIVINNGETATNLKIYPQIEVGEAASQYEAYTAQTLYFQLKDKEAHDLTMKKWDKICKHDDGKWYLDIQTVENVLNGTTKKVYGVYFSNYFNAYYAAFLADSQEIVDGLPIVCTRFFASEKASEALGSCSVSSDRKNIFFRHVNQTMQTAETWNAWLQANPTTVIYQIKKVTSVELDTSVQTVLNSLYTREGIANIFATNLAPPTITLDYARTATGRNIMEIRKELNI